MGIEVRKPSPAQKLEAGNWETWEKEVSEFDWEYAQKETCLILEGKAEIYSDGKKITQFGAGDWVVFPQGLKCRWKITQAVKKKYMFG